MRSLAQKPSVHTKEEAAVPEGDGPARTRAGWLKEFFARRIFNSATLFGVVPVGTAFGHWISKIISLPQLRRLAVGEVSWTPLRKSLSDSTLVLNSTGGVHLRSDTHLHAVRGTARQRNRSQGRDDGRFGSRERSRGCGSRAALLVSALALRPRPSANRAMSPSRELCSMTCFRWQSAHTVQG